MSIKLTLASYKLAGKLEKLDSILSGLNIKRSTLLDYVYPNNVKIAVVHMKLAPFSDLRSFVQTCSSLVDNAVRSGAHVVLFPHLFGLLPVCAHKGAAAIVQKTAADLRAGNVNRARFTQLMEKFSDFVFDCYYTLFLRLAQRYNIYIAAGSTYVSTPKGIRCRSYLFSPDHTEAFFQDKLHLTPNETRLGIQAGDELNILDLKIGRAVLLAGMDAAFFECYKIARGLGAQIVLSPSSLREEGSYTARYNASLIAAQHYSLYTARASFVSAGMDGASGVYAPQLLTRNLDGIIVHTNEAGDENQVLCARIDPPKLIDNVDVYAASSNPDFSQVLANEVYPAYFRSRAPEEGK